MGSSPTNPNPEVLLRLGYDASDTSGLEKARRDVAKYKADAVLLGEQLRRERVRFEAEFSTEARRQTQKRMADLRSEIGAATAAIRGKRGAERQASLERLRELRAEFDAQRAIVAQYDATRMKIAQQRQELAGLEGAARRAQVAAEIFRSGRPPIENRFADALRGQLQNSLLALPGAGALSDAASASRLAGGAGMARLLGGTGLFALAGIPALVQGAKSLGEAAVEGGRFADEIQETAAKTGIASNELLQFVAIGKTVGIGLQDMVTATRTLSKAIVGGGGEDGLEDAGNRGAKVLTALGIATTDTEGRARKINDVLLDLADVFQRTPDGAEKTRIAVELLGRSGQNLIPFLNKGRQGLRELFEFVSQIFPGVESAAVAFDKLENAQARYELSVLGLKASLGQELIPAFAAFTEKLSETLRLLNQLGTADFLKFAASEPFRRLLGLPTALSDPGVSLSQFARNVGVRNNAIRFRSSGDQAVFNAALAKIAENEREGRRQFFVTGFDDAKLRELFTGAERGVGGDARQKLFNEALRQGVVIIGERLAAEKDLTKEAEARWKAALKALGTDKEANEQKRLAAQLEEQRNRTIELRADLAKTIAEAEAKTAGSELERFRILQERAAVVAAALDKARDAEATAQADTEDTRLSLSQRLKAQKDLNDALEQGKKLITEQATLTKEQADALGDLLKDAPLPKLKKVPLSLGPTQKPQLTRDFQEELAALRVQEALGISVLNQELAVRDALNQSLVEQIRLRLAAGVATKEEQAALEELLRDLKANRDAIGKLRTEQFNKGGFGSFLSGLKQFSDIVAKFSPSLNRGLGQVFALLEGIAATFSQLRLVGGGVQDASGNVLGGSAFAGLKNIFRRGSGLNAGQRASGLLGLIGSLTGGITQLLQPGTLNKALGGATLGGTLGAFGGPIGAAIGAALGAALGTVFTTKNPALGALSGFALGGPIGGILGGLFASRRKETAKIAKQIREDVKKTLTSFNEGSKSIKDTIAELERERTAAVTRLSGKKGGKKELQAITDDIDKALTDLRRKQKEVLDAFQSQLGLLRVGEGTRDAAQSVQQIATALKQAADAGASAADQIDFLNLSLTDLKNRIGRDLRDEEQQTIDLLLQNIDLQKQREKVLEDAAEREKQVRQSLGLERALTPEQSAAKQIAAIRKQRDEQIKALDEQQARLNAELEGRAELFDLNLEGLDVDAQRTALIDRQLVMQREITAELVAQIRAQQDFFADLAAGRIPSLPAGVLPSGFATPAGSSFTIGSVQIVVGSGVSPSEAEEIGRGVLAGLMRQARIRSEQGFAS